MLRINFKVFILILILYSNANFTKNYERPIFFTSLGKSGTHLLGKCLFLLTGKKQLSNLTGVEVEDEVNYKKIKDLKNKYVFHKHLNYSAKSIEFIKKSKAISFFMLRDPRDVVVSSYYWIRKKKDSFKNICDLPRNELIKYLIEKSTLHSYRSFMGWTKYPKMCVIRFENLVGPQGGGSLNLQFQEVLKIANHLKLKLNKTQILDVCNNLFGDQSGTFRKGQIGSWKTEFSKEQKYLFYKNWEIILQDLGYKKI